MPFVPHTPDDTTTLLKTIGVSSIDALFDNIPKTLQTSSFDLPTGLSEMQMQRTASTLAKKNKNDLCFVGAGCYEHHIPAAVWDIAHRGEYLTAYTPYQAEASQGTLQLLYEFQTMICELTSMEVANASLYDGATALAEAILMSVRLQKTKPKHCILIPETLHPFYRETIQTIVGMQDIELSLLPFDPSTGTITALPNDPMLYTALVIVQPNFFGCLEDVDTLTNWAHQHHLFVIACVNPLSLALLKPPGQWGEKGVDLVCGEGQPLGIPMASGGSDLGFLSTKMAYVRHMPGRLVGKTTDKAGRNGFTLTLQAREQHIRREKATSNICTNQGLLAIAATVYLSLMGPQGLYQTALACHHKTQQFLQVLTRIPGVQWHFHQPFFHEVVLSFQQDVFEILKKLQQHDILGGFALETYYPTLKNKLLVCVTEMRTDEDIQHYTDTLKALL